MTDRRTKALTADLDLPGFETTAFATPPPLGTATVALVTTASLHHPDQEARYGNRAGTGRTVAADHIPAAIEAFIRVADGTPWKEAGIPGIPARVAQDIRGYYETAARPWPITSPPRGRRHKWKEAPCSTGST